MSVAEKEIVEQDITVLQQRAQDGDVLAQVELANRLRQGRGVKRSVKDAIQWLQRAAEQKNPEALYQLGRCAEDGNGMPQDDRMAAAYYQQAAEGGHAEAQYAFGMCQQGGIGCTRNLHEAVYWVEAAAKQGHENAMLRLNQLREEYEKAKQLQQERQEQIHEAEKQEQLEFVPVDPKPYQLKNKNLNVKDEPEWHPQPQETTFVDRSATPFVILYIVFGIVCGVLMKPIYTSLPNGGTSAYESTYIIWMSIVGGLLGAGVGLLLSGFYKKAAEPLPLFGLLLLMPLVIFLLAGTIASVLIAIFNVVVYLLKGLLTILGILIVLGIIGSFFG